MATTSKFDFGLINDQIKTHTDQIEELVPYLSNGMYVTCGVAIKDVEGNTDYCILIPLSRPAKDTSYTFIINYITLVGISNITPSEIAQAVIQNKKENTVIIKVPSVRVASFPYVCCLVNYTISGIE